jgi:zinc protease
MMRALVIPLIVPLLSLSLVAQTIDRTKPPQTGPLAGYKLPPVQDGTLSNGFKITVVEDKRYPMVEIRLGFPAGTQHDPAALTGLSETVASLLKEGTAMRDARRIAEDLAEIGGDLDAASSSDHLTIGGSALSENIGRLIDLLDDMARNAGFPEEELRLRKQNRIEELKAQRSEPETLAGEKFREILFKGHPYEKTLPTPESIERISRADLLKFRDSFFAPNAATMIVVGDVGNSRAVWEMLEAKFGTWAKRDLPPPPPAKFPAPSHTFTLVNRPGSVQANILSGRIVPARKDPGYFPLMVANTILGGGTSSRLFANVREKLGYAYNVSSHIMPRREIGVLESEMQVRNEVVADAIDAFYGDFRKLMSERVPATDLSNVKNYLSGNFVMRLSTPSGVADQLLTTRLNGLPNSYLETYVDRVRQVEPGQILEAARKYLNPEDATLVVVGDAAKISKALEKYK